MADPEDTVALSTGAASSGDPDIGDQIGRYQLERVLGSGGMGVVFAAHDPDLDRRVALKLLRTGGGRDQTQARARLLREARAMAKLSHPNVITVHEVGTAGGRDFVAMELIDGGNVHDWLADRRRPAPEVLRVMLAAGRGLAAAHAAGLVHRDFKPHNVLLGRDGRVLVTDFGLARGFDELATAAALPTTQATTVPATPAALGLDETVASHGGHSAATPGSLSSTLTQTGMLLGTPAYMAPEQFVSSTTGPHTDQFSFCVALWEGLAGARPFRGGSIEELRDAVSGPALGGGEIPRRLRGVLERGLRRDPAERWPRMDALLAALVRAERRPRQALAIAAIAGITATVAAVLISQRGGAAPPTTTGPCRSADAMIGEVWSPQVIADLGARFGDLPAWTRARAGLAGFTDQWRDVYAQTCARSDAPEFHARVACLAGALDELAALSETLRDAPPEMLRYADMPGTLPSTEGCLDASRRGYPAQPTDPELRAQVAAVRRELALVRVWARGGRGAEAEPRAAAAVEAARALPYRPILAEALQAQAIVWHLSDDLDRAEAGYDAAAVAAEAAGHAQVRAMSMIGYLEIASKRTSDGARIRAMVERTRAAIDGAGADPVSLAAVDLIVADLAFREGDYDGAIASIASARAIFEKQRDIRRAGVAADREAQIRIARNQPGDQLEAEALVRSSLVASEEIFGAAHRATLELVKVLGWLRWQAGALDEAHALFERVARGAPPRDPTAMSDPTERLVRGRVVDPAGVPVAGATVVAGTYVMGDPRVLAFEPGVSGVRAMRQTITGADGRFELWAPALAIAVAEHGALRAAAVELGDGEAELRLQPTGSITGTLTVRGRPPDGDDPALALARYHPPPRIEITTYGFSVYMMMTPTDSDGGWQIAEVPADRYQALVMWATALGDIHRAVVPVTIEPGAASTADLVLDLGGVLIDVIVRSDSAAAIPTAQVLVFPGKVGAPRIKVSALGEQIDRQPAWTGGLAHVADDATATAVGRPQYQPGDIHARISAVKPGPTSICVLPLAGDVLDDAFMESVSDHQLDLEVACTLVDIAATPAIQVIVVEVAPMQRLP